MINSKDVIMDELSKNRDYYKEKIRPIQSRRNDMYKRDGIEYWDEINESYNVALFMEIYDQLAGKLDVPIDDLYCELEELDLSQFFEPNN